MSNSKKILVIGASIAGPAVCYWLKKFGFLPTLIEKNKGIRTGGYAIDLRGVATTVARLMGIYEQVVAARTSLAFGRYVDTHGKLLHEESGEKFGFRQADEVEIARGDLVNILMQTIKDVPCHFNQSVERIEQHSDHVTVHFTDKHSEDFDLVIGADGLHSSTRRMVFAKDEYQLRHLGAYICVFDVPNYLNINHGELLYEADCKQTSITSDKNSSTAFAGFMFRSNHVMDDIRNVSEQKNFLRTTFQHIGWEAQKLLALMENSETFYFDSITQVKMPCWTKGRVALAGDAGYCPSPLSGQGTSLALVGAYSLAGELKQANGNHELAFARYNQLLHPYVEANQQFGVHVSETFLAKEEISAALAEQRGALFLEQMQLASHAIILPNY